MVQTPFCVNNTRDPKFVSNSFGKLTSWYANRGNQNGSNSFLCKQHKGSKVRFKLVSTPDRFRAKTRCAVSLKILVWKCLLLCRSLIFFIHCISDIHVICLLLLRGCGDICDAITYTDFTCNRRIHSQPTTQQASHSTIWTNSVSRTSVKSEATLS